MTLCLVTDRRQLGLRTGAAPSQWANQLIEQIRGAVAGRVDLIQLRESDLEAGALYALARHVMEVVPGVASRLIINDRLDVALAVGAAGVHLRERSYEVPAARTVAGREMKIGCSIHDESGVARRAAASYLIAGTVLPTASKPAGVCLGWEGLRRIVERATTQPVIAIGGLSLLDAGRVASTGASGLAAIGAFIPDGAVPVGPFVQEQAEKLRFAFDSAVKVP